MNRTEAPSVPRIPARQYWKISAFGFVCFLVLMFFVLGSAMGVIITTFENRKLLSELDGLRKEARDMQVLWGQYLVEKSTWATYGRVHEIAEKGLGMQTPVPENMVIVEVRQ